MLIRLPIWAQAMRAEWMKLRRSMIWLAMATLPLLSAVLGTFNFLSNIAILQHEWYSLWTQHALFYCLLFAPTLTGVYCAYVCRLEHLNHNWNQVCTQPVGALTLVLSKLAVVSGLSAVTQALIGVFFILGGKLAGITAPVPVELAYWLLRGWVSLTVYAALLLLPSLVFRSFAIPVAIGMLAGFLGLPALVKGFGGYYPFSLVPLSMCSNNPTEPMQCSAALFAVSCAVWLALGVICCSAWLRRGDVKAG